MSSLSLWLAAGASELVLDLIDGGGLLKLCATMLFKKMCLRKIESVDDTEPRTLLDLPELVLDEIFRRLPPPSLSQMAGVCTELRAKCKSNRLWERLFKAKWGKIVGPAAYKEWQWSWPPSPLYTGGVNCRSPKAWIRPLSCIWPFSWLNLHGNYKKVADDPPLDSLKAWYWALESGTFWFPAQIYNRENGHVGFILSCYDAELSYDRRTDTFRARYPPHGSRTVVIEEGVQWERIRAPPIDTSAHDLHITDCLEELKPGDHVEVQWRRNKDFPYGWWYGVVGHLDMCDRDIRYCRCHLNDIVWLEFNQYTLGSRWRRAAVNRTAHREEGNDSEGYYGGVRKIDTNEEVHTWKRLWPNEALE